MHGSSLVLRKQLSLLRQRARGWFRGCRCKSLLRILLRATLSQGGRLPLKYFSVAGVHHGRLGTQLSLTTTRYCGLPLFGSSVSTRLHSLMRRLGLAMQTWQIRSSTSASASENKGCCNCYHTRRRRSRRQKNCLVCCLDDDEVLLSS